MNCPVLAEDTTKAASGQLTLPPGGQHVAVAGVGILLAQVVLQHASSTAWMG